MKIDEGLPMSSNPGLSGEKFLIPCVRNCVSWKGRASSDVPSGAFWPIRRTSVYSCEACPRPGPGMKSCTSLFHLQPYTVRKYVWLHNGKRANEKKGKSKESSLTSIKWNKCLFGWMKLRIACESTNLFQLCACSTVCPVCPTGLTVTCNGHVCL